MTVLKFKNKAQRNREKLEKDLEIIQNQLSQLDKNWAQHQYEMCLQLADEYLKEAIKIKKTFNL